MFSLGLIHSLSSFGLKSTTCTSSLTLESTTRTFESRCLLCLKAEYFLHSSNDSSLFLELERTKESCCREDYKGVS